MQKCILRGPIFKKLQGGRHPIHLHRKVFPLVRVLHLLLLKFLAYSVSYWKSCAYIRNRGHTSYSVKCYFLMCWISDHKVLDKVCVSFCPQKVLSDRKDLLSRSCTRLRTAKKPPAVHVQSRSSFIHRKDDRKVYVLIKYLRLCFTYIFNILHTAGCSNWLLKL